MRIINKILLLGLILVTRNLPAQIISLTPENNHIVVKKVGTVTFKYNNDVHVDKAREEGLYNISGLTFSAGIIYDIAFENGIVIGLSV